MKQFFSLLTAVILLFMFCTGCNTVKVTEPDSTEKLSRYEGSFLDVFDTVTRIVVYAETEATASAIVDNIHAQLLNHHQLFDIYNDYPGIHNLKTINDNAGIRPVKVDKQILDLLDYAKKMYTFTGGKMNVALGSVLQIWHNYREAGIDDPVNAALPPIADLKAANAHTNIDHLIIDRDASTVYLADPTMQLDVGAIAKGYAAQLVIDKLRAEGVQHLLLSIGGNVCGIGLRGDGTPWKVGVQSPDMQSNLCTVALTNLNLVTSGSYQRYYTVNGQQYHHIIDPETLMPADYFVSVSILCDDSGKADALSTALFNMPLSDGRTMIESLDGVEAMWTDQNGVETFSSGFESLLIHD
ncbi:MAG: FAD:protein FMN transferase [Clostridia bacterium]